MLLFIFTLRLLFPLLFQEEISSNPLPFFHSPFPTADGLLTRRARRGRRLNSLPVYDPVGAVGCILYFLVPLFNKRSIVEICNRLIYLPEARIAE